MVKIITCPLLRINLERKNKLGKIDFNNPTFERFAFNNPTYLLLSSNPTYLLLSDNPTFTPHSLIMHRTGKILGATCNLTTWHSTIISFVFLIFLIMLKLMRDQNYEYKPKKKASSPAPKDTLYFCVVLFYVGNIPSFIF